MRNLVPFAPIVNVNHAYRLANADLIKAERADCDSVFTETAAADDAHLGHLLDDADQGIGPVRRILQDGRPRFVDTGALYTY